MRSISASLTLPVFSSRSASALRYFSPGISRSWPDLMIFSASHTDHQSVITSHLKPSWLRSRSVITVLLWPAHSPLIWL